MGKNIRRGRTGNVRCASCGQLTRRDRSVYLFKNGLKSYYCPDCAKKIHGSRLYKGMPKFIKRKSTPKVKRKFAIYSTSDQTSHQMEESPEAEDRNLPDESAGLIDGDQNMQTNSDQEEIHEEYQQ